MAALHSAVIWQCSITARSKM